MTSEGMRRGESAEGVLVVLAIIVLCAIALGWIAHATYETGYRNGQIDSLEGTVRYTSVADGTLWYREFAPKKLYKSRKKKDDS